MPMVQKGLRNNVNLRYNDRKFFSLKSHMLTANLNSLSLRTCQYMRMSYILDKYCNKILWDKIAYCIS